MAATVHVREDRLRPVRLRPSASEVRLRWMHAIAAAALLVLAAIVLVLAAESALPVTATSLDRRGGSPGLRQLFTVPLAPLVAAILSVSAVFHLLVASPALFPAYVRELRNHRNRFRWSDRAVSTSLVVVLIALWSGITDAAALAALFAATSASALFGWQMEARNDLVPRVVWSPLVMGCVVGVVPWLAIASAVSAGSPVDAPFPSVLVVSAIVWALLAAEVLAQWLHHAGLGWWRRYHILDGVAVGLGVVARYVLAWPVLAGGLPGG